MSSNTGANPLNWITLPFKGGTNPCPLFDILFRNAQSKRPAIRLCLTTFIINNHYSKSMSSLINLFPKVVSCFPLMTKKAFSDLFRGDIIGFTSLAN